MELKLFWTDIRPYTRSDIEYLAGYPAKCAAYIYFRLMLIKSYVINLLRAKIIDYIMTSFKILILIITLSCYDL